MHPDNAQQFKFNMDTIARFAGYQGLQGNDAGEPPLTLCPQCGEEVSVDELRADKVCDSCFRENYVKDTK